MFVIEVRNALSLVLRIGLHGILRAVILVIFRKTEKPEFSMQAPR